MDVETRLLRLIERQNTQRQCLEKLTSVVIELINEDEFTIDPSYRDITLEWDGGLQPSSTGADSGLTPLSSRDIHSSDFGYWQDLWLRFPEAVPTLNKYHEEPFIVFASDDEPLLAQRLDVNSLADHVAYAWEKQRRTKAVQPELIRRTGEIPSYFEEHEVTEDFAERHHAVFFIKLFLFIFLFDLEMEYLSLLAFVFFLHVNGVFDPIIRWFRQFRRRQNAQPLDRILRHLEERNQVTREQAASIGDVRTPPPITAPEAAPPQSPEIPPAFHAPDNNQAAATPSPHPPHGEASPLLQSAAYVSPPVTQAPSLPLEKHIAVRWFYQTVVMFVGTLMPWWKPDQAYLM